MKRLYLILLLFSSFFFVTAFGQKFNTEEIINAWRVSDSSQSSRADAVNWDLETYPNAVAYNQRIIELRNEISNHPDKRLKARMFIYETLGKQVFGDKLKPGNTKQFENVIKLAQLLKDKQLLADLYTFYADRGTDNLEEELLLSLKAIEVQKSIGGNNYPKKYAHFFTASLVTFKTLNYKECIVNGVESLNLMESSSTMSLRNYILQLDIIGASYKELGNADSAIYYYQKIKKILSPDHVNNERFNKSPSVDSIYLKIWTGISSGGIGQGLFLQKKYDSAYVLLEQNVRSSIATKQFGDAAIAQSTMAEINFYKKNYRSALAQWQQSLQWSRKSNDLKNATNSALGISKVFKVTGKYDSAYYYNVVYNNYKDSLLSMINNSKLAAVNARIDFDEVKASLGNAESTIKRQVYIRNLILSAIAFFTIIAILLYNRYRLKQNLAQERLEKKNKIAAIEMAYTKEQMKDAQKQLSAFARNISEKQLLIETLQSDFGQEIKYNANAALRTFTILTEEDWQLFKEDFEKAHPGFWERLNEKMPGLTLSEQRFMALSRLGLTNKEMAAATGVSPESIRVLIYRLRKKFSLEESGEAKTIAQSI